MIALDHVDWLHGVRVVMVAGRFLGTVRVLLLGRRHNNGLHDGRLDDGGRLHVGLDRLLDADRLHVGDLVRLLVRLPTDGTHLLDRLPDHHLFAALVMVRVIGRPAPVMLIVDDHDNDLVVVTAIAVLVSSARARAVTGLSERLLGISCLVMIVKVFICCGKDIMFKVRIAVEKYSSLFSSTLSTYLRIGLQSPRSRWLRT